MTTVPSAALAYNLYLKHDLVRVARAFADAGIPWLLLKGFGLADAAYGGVATRPMVDNDVVVRPWQAVRAHQVLLRLGFYDRPGNVLALNLRADFEHPMHHPYPDVETGLELHWHIYAPELFRGPVEPYFERAVTRELCGVPVLTLNNEDRLVQLATHWMQHGLNEPRILTDIERLWNRRQDVRNRLVSSTLVRRLRESGAHAVFGLALHSLRRAGRLDGPVPEPLQSRRAEAFFRVLGGYLLRATSADGPALSGAEEHRLRLASWALLTPSRGLASARRELVPSHARLSRIAGRPLSWGETLASFGARQLGGLLKVLRDQPEQELHSLARE